MKDFFLSSNITLRARTRITKKLSYRGVFTVIPTQVGIQDIQVIANQKGTGYRIKSGMTELAI